MRARFLRLWHEDEGQGLTEYALLLILVCATAVATMRSFATSVADMYSEASNRITIAGLSTSKSGSSLSYSHSSITTTQDKKFHSGLMNMTTSIRSKRP